MQPELAPADPVRCCGRAARCCAPASASAALCAVRLRPGRLRCHHQVQQGLMLLATRQPLWRRVYGVRIEWACQHAPAHPYARARSTPAAGTGHGTPGGVPACLPSGGVPSRPGDLFQGFRALSGPDVRGGFWGAGCSVQGVNSTLWGPGQGSCRCARAGQGIAAAPPHLVVPARWGRAGPEGVHSCVGAVPSAAWPGAGEDGRMCASAAASAAAVAAAAAHM